ncbi:MAG: glycosyltransferase family 2 protein, partial [Planctomycetota bacterium]|nr:glycosyltransferase family 2 protein [Planctomycetota bacterium]
MAPPSLALCIPAHDEERWLPRLLESARDQTVPFDEVFVYDDASSDRTSEVARSFGATVVRGDDARGCSHGKNALAALARSEWLHFIDADDFLYPDFVETARRWLEAPGCPDVVMFSYDEVEEDGAKFGERIFDDWALRVDPIWHTILDQHNNFGVYRRRAFLAAGGYDTDPRVLYNEDDAFHCRLARAGLRFRAELRPRSAKTRRARSMSSGRTRECARARYHVLLDGAKVLGPRYHPALARRAWATAGVLGAVGDWDYADRCLALARGLGGAWPGVGSARFGL